MKLCKIKCALQKPAVVPKAKGFFLEKRKGGKLPLGIALHPLESSIVCSDRIDNYLRYVKSSNARCTLNLLGSDDKFAKEVFSSVFLTILERFEL